MAVEERRDLTRGPVGRHLRRQAVPFGLGLVAIFSFEAVDLFFISRLGDAPLAAVSFTFPVIWLIYGIGIGFEAGAASCVSRAVGRGDEIQARRLTTDTALLAAIVASGLALAGLANIPAIFSLLGAPTDLLPLIRDYMGTWFWVAPLDMVLWCSLASMRARGETPLESKIITGAALLNLGLDPLLIFGFGPVPAMGVRGAALATLLSTAAMLGFSLLYLGLRRHVFAPLLAPWSDILSSWKHMLHIGLPAMATNAIIPLSSAIVVSLIAVQGTEAVAGYGVAMRIEPMFLIPFYALSAISSPFFGQNSGAGFYDRLLEAQRAVVRFCAALGLALAVILWLSAPLLAGMFSENPAIVHVAVLYLSLVPWSWGAHGVVMSTNASFNGMGQPFPGVVISVCRVIVVFLPLALLGRAWFGLGGLFGAAAVSNLAMGLVSYGWLGRAVRRSAAGR